MSLRICFPNGKKRALTLSYDDNQIFDRRLVALLNKYNIKATFHLNSGTFCDRSNDQAFISSSEVKDLYKGHEIAIHGYSHPYLSQLPDGLILKEIVSDRTRLERLSGQIVRGMSYPFGDFSQRLIDIASSCGIEYSRTVEDTYSFNIPDNFMTWHPTCHHNKALSLVDEFLGGPSFRDMALFYVWGHSFEFDRENTWDMMEEFCRQISQKEDVYYATNIEIKEYITAARSLVTDADVSKIYNPTATDVYIIYDGQVVLIKKGETITL